MPTTPTVAIGIGAAGARMLSELDNFVSEEGSQNQFHYISIDSNESDARNLSPDTAYPISLRVPETPDEREHNIEEFSYLRSGTSIGTQGTDRTRSVARYFVDNTETYTRLRDQLEREITDFWDERRSAIEEDRVHDLHIWLIHSLGGGTGSGTYPLIAAMLQRITADMDVTINGLGSLPRLDGLEADDQAPDDTQFYANAYASLYELRKIVEQDASDEPLEITLEHAEYDDSVTADSLAIERNPFDMYWFIGYDEESEEASYRKRMNEIAAVNVFYYANKSSLENFPDDQEYQDNVFYGISAAELSAPVDLARRYVELGSEIDACDDLLEVLDDELAEHKQSRKYLEEVRDTQLDLEDVDVEFDHIREDVVRASQDRARGLKLYEVLGDDAEFDIDEEVSELLSEVEENIRDPELTNPTAPLLSPGELAARDEEPAEGGSETVRNVDEYDPDPVFEPRTVVEWFYCDQLQKKLESELRAHQFNAVVEEVWSNHAREGLEEEYGHLADADPDRRWTNGLESWLIDRWDELDEEIEQISWNKIRERRLQSQQDQLDEEYQRLSQLYEKYQALDGVRKDAHSKRETAMKVLDGDISQLKALIDDKSDRRTTIKNQRETKVTTRQDRRESLASFQEDDNHVGLRMQKLDALTLDTLDQATSITSLMSRGFITEEDAANALSTLLQGINDPIHDDIRDFQSRADEILGVFTHPSNIEPPTEYDVSGLLDLEITGDQDIADIIIELDYYDQEMIVDSQQGFSLWLLKWFTPITLTNTSEFGTIHEYFIDDETDISAQLGGNISDEDVAGRFAYPELFSPAENPEERKITAPFEN